MPRAALSSPIRALAPALALSLAAATALAGCSGASQHQVIDANEACATCHSEEKPSYERVEDPAGTAQSGTQVRVKVPDAAAVVVAEPLFTSEDGARFVPVQVRTASLSGGEAALELDDGLWALCVDDGDVARAQLVRVDSASDAVAVVEL